MSEAACECARMLAAGAYGGWWCPVHRDVLPASYAVEAVKMLHERVCAAELRAATPLQSDAQGGKA